MSQSTERRAAREPQPVRPVPRAGLRRRVLAGSIVAAFGIAPGLGLAQLPAGHSVVAGTASVVSGEGRMTVTNSPNAVLNWQSFSIGTDNAVHFQQPDAASKVLNRVVGNDPSSILGSLSSNGEVWLLNPHGVLFGNEARIDVGGLVASTLGVTNDDFLTGRNRFGAAGTQGGQVLNQSRLTTSFGGRVWLVGGTVRNEGLIETPGGQVVLAAGQSIDLVDSGLPNVTVRVSAPGNTVVNLGELLAPSGGSIDLHGAMVNQEGIVRADSLDASTTGRVVIRAQGDVLLAAGSQTEAGAGDGEGAGGSVLVESVTGTTTVMGGVRAVGRGYNGGQIHLLGNEVNVELPVENEVEIDASGTTGGGEVLIGGDSLGANPAVRNAVNTSVNGWIRAQAFASGDGGKIVIRADGATRVAGALVATGGVNGGRGGAVETSSAQLDIDTQVWLTGSVGDGGTWLLGADNLTVVQGQFDQPRLPAPPIGSAAVGLDSSIPNHLLDFALDQGARVTLRAGGQGATTQAGNIVVGASITPSAPDMGAALELKAHGGIKLAQDVTIGMGGSGREIRLTSDLDGDGVGTISFGPGAMIATGGRDVRLAGGPGGEGRAQAIDLDGGAINAAGGAISLAGQTMDIRSDSSLQGRDVAISGGAIRLTGADVGAHAGEGNITLAGDTVDLTDTTMLTTGNLRIAGATSIGLSNASLTSTAQSDAIVLSSARLTATESRLDAPSGRWLVYLDAVTDAFAPAQYEQLGYTFMQVGVGAEGEPWVYGQGQHGLLVRDNLNVRVKVDATRFYDGTTRATFSRALENNLGPQFVLEERGVSAEAQFIDKHAGIDKVIIHETDDPPFNVRTTGGMLVYNTRPTYVADVVPRTVTATTLAAAGKVYDATRSAALSGAVSGILDGDDASLDGAYGLFADKHAGAGKLVTVTGATLGGADGRNYRLDSTPLLADITPRQLDGAGLTALDKIYDGTRNATVGGALAGILKGDSVVVGNASALFGDKNAGIGKTVTISDAVLTGADANNYRFGGATSVQATISQRQLGANGITVLDKVYDGTRAATLSVSLAGVVDGDSVSLSDATALFGDKQAGVNKAVTVSGATLSGADAGNYQLGELGAVTADITPLALGADALTVADKVYDGARSAVLAASLTGIIAGDSVRLEGAAGQFADKHAGANKLVTLAGGTLGGADAGNYVLNSASTGRATITPRAIAATGVSALDKVYDGTRAAMLTGALSDIVAGDSVTLEGASGLFADKHAGAAKTVTIAGATLGGADAGNYRLQDAGPLLAAITPRPIAATGLTALDKVYDGTRTATVAGALADTLAGDALELDAVAQFDAADVGAVRNVTITGVLRGADAANYTLTAPSTVSAAITHRPLDIVIQGDVRKEYDATTLAGLAPGAFLLNGVVAGDDLAVRGPAQGSFASANVGQGIGVRANGTFDISGARAANYRVGTVNLDGASNRVEATAFGNVGAIAPATLVYEARPGMYVGSAFVGALGGTVSGFKGGDTLASATTGALQWQTPAMPGTPSGAHPVFGSGLAAANYVFVQAPGNATALTLTPGVVAGGPEQRAQDGGNRALASALQAVQPALDVRVMGGALFDRASHAAARGFGAVNIGTMNQGDLAQLLAQRRDFKRKLFADAVYKLAIDPSLADVRPCASAADASTGTCLLTPAQLTLIDAAKTQVATAAAAAAATVPTRSGKARIASVPQIERKIAVFVGINTYGDKNIPQLENAIPDADAVGKQFAEKLGYDVRVLHNPDKAGIIRALNALAGEVSSSDSVVIYFAGHGYSLEENGAGYWLASDATVTDPNGWISNSDIARLLAGLRSKQVTLISDSCYSGAFAREGLGAVGQNVTVDDVLAKRSVVVLSSGGDEPVADEGKGGHSIFAWNLMQVVGSVTNWTPGSTVFADVQKGVRKEFPQTPKYGSVTAAGHQAGGDYLFESRSN